MTLLDIRPDDGPTGSYTFRDDEGNTRGCPARVAATAENAAADIAAWLAGEYSAPVPVPRWTPGEFWARFTEAEQLAFLAAGRAETAVDLLRQRLLLAPEIVADSPDLADALGYLVHVGVITAARAAAVLSP